MVMEEIIITDVEKIARVVAKTIDRFTNLAEAISVTEEGRSCIQNVSKISVCRTIMTELNSTKIDYDGLFDVLENVIMTLVADGFSGCCQTKQTELPNLTAMQKEALRKTVTFDELLIKELKIQEKDLRKLIKKHKKIMADIEKYRRESTKHQNKLATILYQLHESGPMKKGLLLFLQMKRDRVQKELVRAKSACRIIADLEREIRSQIQKVSMSIVHVVSDKICGRLQYGIESYLYEVISKMQQQENRRRAIEWIRHINLQEMTDRLVDLCSDVYVIKDTSAKGELTLEDVSSFTGSIDESTGITDENTGTCAETAAMNRIKPEISNGTANKKLPPCGGDMCKKIGFCSGDENYRLRRGISSRKIRKVKVRVTKVSDRMTPGFIDTQPGLVIRQTANKVDGINVGFGYYQPRKFGAKQWGFFFVKPTH